MKAGTWILLVLLDVRIFRGYLQPVNRLPTPDKTVPTLLLLQAKPFRSADRYTCWRRKYRVSVWTYTAENDVLARPPSALWLAIVFSHCAPCIVWLWSKAMQRKSHILDSQIIFEIQKRNFFYFALFFTNPDYNSPRKNAPLTLTHMSWSFSLTNTQLILLNNRKMVTYPLISYEFVKQ